VLPVSIVYVTDAEFKKKYLPWSYSTPNVVTRKADFSFLGEEEMTEEIKKLLERNDRRKKERDSSN
jgi:hypothetical protein